jgi:hypothetical protein
MMSRFCAAAIFASFLVCAQGNADAQVLYLQPSGAALSPGAVANVDIRLDSQTGTAPSGLQWTLSYSSADLQFLQIAPGPVATAASKTVTCVPQSGATMCLVYGTNGTAIANGVVATVSFVVPPSFPGFTFLSLSGQSAASPTGSAITIGARGTGLGATLPGVLIPPQGCDYALGTTSQTLGPAGGTGSIAITTTSNCAWQAFSTVPWIAVTSSSGTGNSSASFQVSANSGAPRSGTILIAGWAFAVTQQGADGSLPGAGLTGGAMAHVVAGGPWKTTLTIVNTGLTQASAYLGFFDNSGNAAPFTWNFLQNLGIGPQSISLLAQPLAPGATLVIQTAPTTSIVEGWAHLQTQGSVSGFAVFTNITSGQEAVVPLDSNGDNPHLLAFDNTNGVVTGLAISNLTGFGADIPVTFRDARGGVLGNSTVHLEPRGHASFMLEDAFSVTASQRGTLEFDPPAGVQIGVLGLRANGKAITTLPVLVDPGGDGTGSMAQIVSGQDWKTTLTLVNTRSAPGTFATQWYNDGGTPLTLQMRNIQTGAINYVSSTNDVVPASASLLLETPAIRPVPDAVGFTQVTAPGANGFVIFRYEPTAQEAAVPLETRNASAYMLAFDNTNPFATGLAVANLTVQTVDIPVTIRDDAGTVLNYEVIHLGGEAHTSFMLTDRYTYTANRRGTVEFGTPAGGRISVIGLRGSTGGALTTLPILTRGN